MDIRRHYKPIFFLLIFAFIFMATRVYVYADTRYVSDNLIITMRGGSGSEYKIIKMLKTGTPVEVIEENDQYYKVRTEDGKEGWVLKRYITTDTPKPIVIAGLKRKIERLNSKIDMLSKERDGLKKGLKSAKDLHNADLKKLEKSIKEKNDRVYSITKQLKGITDKYNRLVEASGDVPSIVSERDKLREENTDLNTEKNDLLKENERLSDKKSILWFLAGAAVFFFGWIAGKLSRKKKRSSFL